MHFILPASVVYLSKPRSHSAKKARNASLIRALMAVASVLFLASGFAFAQGGDRAGNSGSSTAPTATSGANLQPVSLVQGVGRNDYGKALAGTSASPSAAPNASAQGLSSLPQDAQGPISATLGKDDRRYWAHARAGGFRAEGPQGALAVDFARQGARVCSKAGNQSSCWGLETRGYGYGEALTPLNAARPQARANRVEYRRGGVTEWYVNGPLGLEQGFTLAEPPGKANGQPLTVALALSGDLAAALEPNGTALKLTGKNGQTALRYTGLSARDATGRELRSWMELRGERLLLRVDDSGARYPLVVDPWVQQAELTASDGAAADYFGGSVAVSGSTAVVAAPSHTVGSNQLQGAAYVFVQNGTAWSQQAELTASDGEAYDQFGSSVAVQGSIVVVGAASHTVGSNTNQGAAYVFVQSGTTWSQQAELTASDGAAHDGFGNSVAVSGSTAVVGAINHTVGSNKYQGAAYVFVQSGTTWSQQAELTASDGERDDGFGYSLAVSGSTAVVGPNIHKVGSNAGQGAAYVFVQSGTTWSQQAELTASDGAEEDYFGYSVAVSGSTAVVAAPTHTVGSSVYQGAAYVFVQSGTTWSQQAELTASDGAEYDRFGFSVAVSGGTAVIGAVSHTVGSNATQGAAYVFLQSGTTWSQQAELTASDGAAGDQFGVSVAVSGSTAVVGAISHTVGSNAYQGAAYVFTPPTAPPTATTVDVASSPVTYGNLAQLSATVVATHGGATPTGMVAFYANGSELGTEMLNSAGVAAYSTTALGAGTYSITATYQGSAIYSGSTSTAQTLTVDKALLTVAPHPPFGNAAYFSLGYGDRFPYATDICQITGFVNGDGLSAVSGSPVYTISWGADPAPPVGDYTLSCALGTLAAANYTFTLNSTPETIAVTPALITLKPEAANVSYGKPLPGFSYVVAGLKYGQTASVLQGQPVLTTTAVEGSPVGIYPISANVSGVTAPNYTVVAIPNGELTIKAVKVQVRALSTSIIFGQPIPTFSYAFSGFVNGDTASVVSGAPTIATTAVEGSAPGDYPISINVSGMSAQNYVFEPGPNATLVIKP